MFHCIMGIISTVPGLICIPTLFSIYLLTSNCFPVLFLQLFVSLIIAIVIGVRWYLIASQIGLSPLAHAIKRLFRQLLSAVFLVLRSDCSGYLPKFSWIIYFY